MKLMRKLVRLYSERGDWVVDACSGSGSTIVSALMERRNVVAIDKDPRCMQFVKARIVSLASFPDEECELGVDCKLPGHGKTSHLEPCHPRPGHHVINGKHLLEVQVCDGEVASPCGRNFTGEDLSKWSFWRTPFLMRPCS